jgi:predicted nucleic acid-binding protein
LSVPLYADTSALVAYYVPEELSEQVQATLQLHTGPTISDLVELEFFSALSLKLRIGELQRSGIDNAAALFLRHIEDGLYSRLHLHAGHFRLARDFIGRFDLPLKAPDSLHLAVCATEGLRLLTLDEQLARNAEALGIEVQSLDR